MTSKPFLPQPKPLSRLAITLEKRRKEKKAGELFRAAVWIRCGGRCVFCGRRCVRTTELRPERGEIDHLVPRSLSKAKKFDPANGQLLCKRCHDVRHGR